MSLGYHRYFKMSVGSRLFFGGCTMYTSHGNKTIVFYYIILC